MTGLRIFLLLTASFGCICFNVVKGDYYTDGDYEDGKTFFDYVDKWYYDDDDGNEQGSGNDVDDKDAAVNDQFKNEQGSRHEPVFIRDSNQIIPVVIANEPNSNQDSNQIIPEVIPTDSDYVVPGQSDNDTLDPLFILDMEKRLQAEMGRVEDQLFLLHKLISNIFGPQVTLNSPDNFDSNSILINLPLNQGGNWGYNPFNIGYGDFFNYYSDELDESGEDAWNSLFDYGYGGEDSWNPWFDDGYGNDDSLSPGFDDGYNADDAWGSWFQDTPKFPNLSDVFGLPDEWANLPSNYSNSTHDIQHVNGSVIAVNETINKQSGDDFNFFSHKKEVHVQPENIVD